MKKKHGPSPRSRERPGHMAGDFSMFQPPKSRYLGLLYVGISYQLTKFCWVNQLWLRYIISVDISYIYICCIPLHMYICIYIYMYIYHRCQVEASKTPRERWLRPCDGPRCGCPVRSPDWTVPQGSSGGMYLFTWSLYYIYVLN